MCLAENSLDSIVAPDCRALERFACEALPDHQFTLRTNAEGIAWVVFEPSMRGTQSRRITICRIAPCVMVLVEDEDGRRDICSASDVAGAIAFVRDTLDKAVLAAVNAHSIHGTLQ